MQISLKKPNKPEMKQQELHYCRKVKEVKIEQLKT